MALTPKQSAFVIEYVRTFNATQAALDAGYAPRSARQLGWRLLTHPEVAEEIRAIIAERSLSADEALIRLTEQARAGYSPYIQADGSVNLRQMIADGKGHLIKKVKPTRWGREIEFYDAQTALIHIDNRHRAAPADSPTDEPAGDWWEAADQGDQHDGTKQTLGSSDQP